MNSPPSLEKISKLNSIADTPLLYMSYGSKKKDSDLDLFLLYENPIKKSVFKDNYDLSQIGTQKFKEKLSYRDIEYTEPILTGEFLFGNEKILSDSLDFLLNNKPNEIIYDYLGNRSIETFLQANSLYEEGKVDMFIKMAYSGCPSSEIKKNLFDNEITFNSPILDKSLSTLTYALSYLSSIHRYKSGEKVVTISDIIDDPRNEIEEEFSNLRRYFKSCSKGKDKLSFEKIDSHFDLTKDLLKRGL